MACTNNSLGSSSNSSSISSPALSLASCENAAIAPPPKPESFTSYLDPNERFSMFLMAASKCTLEKEKSTTSANEKRVNWKNPALYKTRLCDYWSTGNTCKFGLNCWYAHGPLELRHVPRLDQNPEATSIALAEVVHSLPPCRERTLALELAESHLVANIKSNALLRSKNDLLPSPPRSAPAQLSSVSFFGSASMNMPNQSNGINDVNSVISDNPVIKAIKRSVVGNSTVKGLSSARIAYSPYLREQTPPPAFKSFCSQSSMMPPTSTQMSSSPMPNSFNLAPSYVMPPRKIDDSFLNCNQSYARSHANTDEPLMMSSSVTSNVKPSENFYQLFEGTNPHWCTNFESVYKL